MSTISTIVTPALAILVLVEALTGIGRTYIETRFGF